jgi:Histidine phosphatase superfamily (branch 2)
MIAAVLQFWISRYLGTFVVASPFQLRQVHVITRHGSRRPLSKSSTTLDDTSESSLLTPLGQLQHYELGEWLRERYISTTNFSDVLIEYDPTHFLVESTAYERTLVSANSLLLGLFPRESRGEQVFNETPAVIPVYSRARNNDLNLRAYDKCNSLRDKLEKLYASDMWKSMETENMALLRRLAQVPSFSKYVSVHDALSSVPYIPLTELWNVYDLIHVVETECGFANTTALDDDTSSQVCQELPDPTLLSLIDVADRNATYLLANAVELLRFSPAVAGNTVGGSLLSLILQRMETLANNSLTAPNFLFVTSAHYPTLLGLFSALETNFMNQYIPEYASALVLELYLQAEDRQHYVKVFFKSGGSIDTAPIVVSNICRTDLDAGCNMVQFRQETQLNRLTPEAWCEVCNNSDVDVCLQYRLQQSSNSTPTDVNVCSQDDKYLYAVTFFGGVLFAVILLLLWNSHRSRTSTEIASKSNEPARIVDGSDVTPNHDAAVASSVASKYVDDEVFHT